MSAIFRPPWWLKNGHLQTVYPFLFRALELRRHREVIHTADGDRFSVDWMGEGEKGVVVLIHGLTGSSESGYILGLQRYLVSEGFIVAALNCRACDGQPNLKAGSYHAGFTNDLDLLCQQIKRDYPNRSLLLAGFSLGGNMMLKWLGEKTDEVDITAAVAVSVPYKLGHCADKVDQGLAKGYRNHMISAMKQKLSNKKQFFRQQDMWSEYEKLQALGDLSWIKSFWQFDDHVVARLHGFDGVHDYYQKNSSIGFLRSIQTPTLLIHAEDDPMLPLSILPKKAELSESIQLNVYPHGGHVGFVSQSVKSGLSYWLEPTITSFFKTQLATT